MFFSEIGLLLDSSGCSAHAENEIIESSKISFESDELPKCCETFLIFLFIFAVKCGLVGRGVAPFQVGSVGVWS